MGKRRFFIGVIDPMAIYRPCQVSNLEVSLFWRELSGPGRFEQTAAVDEVNALWWRRFVIGVGVVGIVGAAVGHNSGTTQSGFYYFAS